MAQIQTGQCHNPRSSQDGGTIAKDAMRNLHSCCPVQSWLHCVHQTNDALDKSIKIHQACFAPAPYPARPDFCKVPSKLQDIHRRTIGYRLLAAQWGNHAQLNRASLPNWQYNLAAQLCTELKCPVKKIPPYRIRCHCFSLRVMAESLML